MKITCRRFVEYIVILSLIPGWSWVRLEWRLTERVDGRRVASTCAGGRCRGKSAGIKKDLYRLGVTARNRS